MSIGTMVWPDGQFRECAEGLQRGGGDAMVMEWSVDLMVTPYARRESMCEL